MLHRWCDTVPTPWRNGGGLTREIARGSSSEGDASEAGFDWRLSIAEVAAGGPFSTFPGVDRLLVLLSGAGLDLAVSGDLAVPDDLAVPGELAQEGKLVQLRPPFGAHAFAGEATVEASLADGPTTDLNVMCRRGAWEATAELVEGAGALGIPSVAVALVHVVEGEITLESGDVLGIGDTVESHGPTALRWRGGTVVVAALQPSRPR